MYSPPWVKNTKTTSRFKGRGHMRRKKHRTKKASQAKIMTHSIWGLIEMYFAFSSHFHMLAYFAVVQPLHFTHVQRYYYMTGTGQCLLFQRNLFTINLHDRLMATCRYHVRQASESTLTWTSRDEPASWQGTFLDLHIGFSQSMQHQWNLRVLQARHATFSFHSVVLYRSP